METLETELAFFLRQQKGHLVALLSLLACYRRLSKCLQSETPAELPDRDNPFFRELLKQTVENPLAEEEIKSTIQRIGSIANDISKNVMKQYEEHPYPTWNKRKQSQIA